MSATQAQRAALRWLEEHNGSGVFDKTRVLLAGGERAPVMWKTWKRLLDLGLVHVPSGRRLDISAAGYAALATKLYRNTAPSYGNSFEEPYHD